MPEETQGNPTPSSSHTRTETSWSSTWRSWPCRSGVPASAPPSPGAPRLSCAPAPLKTGDAQQPPHHQRPSSGARDTDTKQGCSLAWLPGQLSPSNGGSAPTARAVNGVWVAPSPSREPRHLLTVTGASSSHLPSCFLAF